MNAQDTTASIRNIRRVLADHVSGKRPASPSMIIRAMENLERDLAPDTAESYEIGIVGFDTILSYLSKEDRFTLDMMDDVVFNTIEDGKALSKSARARGLPILKVSAPAAITTRFPKVTHVNAYPTHLLADHFGI